jgi:hypothetical protein
MLSVDPQPIRGGGRHVQSRLVRCRLRVLCSRAIEVTGNAKAEAPTRIVPAVRSSGNMFAMHSEYLSTKSK